MPCQKRFFLSVLGLCLCCVLTTQAADSTFLIGKLTQQSYCQDKKWVDPHFEIGFVPVVLSAEIDTSAYSQKMVIATGTIDQSLPLKKLFIGSACSEEAQSRGDWVWGQDGGVRVLHDVPAWMRPRLKWNEFETPTFRVKSLKPFTGLQSKLSGQDAVATFTNTTDKELKNLTLKAHYEGCYGKPMSAMQEKTFPSVTVGGKVTASFPQIFVKPRPQHSVPGDRDQHALSSIQIVSENKDVWFDFDADVKTDLGLTIECPRMDRNDRKT